MSDPKTQTTVELLSLGERTQRNVAVYNIAIMDAVTTCRNILNSHDHNHTYVLLEEKLIGALNDLKRATL